MRSEASYYAQEQYLERAIRFIEDCRKEDPLGGMWDVGDINWWWRDGGYENPETQLFLESGDSSETLAMILLSEQYSTFDYEMRPGLERTETGLAAFRIGLEWLAALRSRTGAARPVTFFVHERHGAFRKAAEAQGYAALPKGYAQLALTLTDIRTGGTTTGGPMHVRSIEDADFESGRPPVIRTPPSKFARVLEAPLYRRDNHLVAVTNRDEVAAECLFWIDETNSIGMFEPVETKVGFRRMGAARALLNEGLSRMDAANVEIAKVSHYTDNIPARHLYRSLGFSPRFTRLTYSSE